MSRYRDNHRLFIEDNLKIKIKEGGKIIPLYFNRPQTLVYYHYANSLRLGIPVRLLIVKGRQMGVSTLTDALLFTRSVLYSDTLSFIVSYDGGQVSELLTMIKLFYDMMPEGLVPMQRIRNANELCFENPNPREGRTNPGLRSKIKISVDKEVVGFTGQNLHGSEVAYWANAKTTYEAITQGIVYHPNTCIILETTGCNPGHYVHELWQKSKVGESKFINIFLPWFIDERYILPVNREICNHITKTITDYERGLVKQFNLSYEQLFWKREITEDKCSGSEETFKTWYPAREEEAFFEVDTSVYDIDVLSRVARMVEDPKFKGNWEEKYNPHRIGFAPSSRGKVWIWEHPKRETRYVLGVDPTFGLGSDFQAVSIYDEDYNQVLEYRDQESLDIFAERIVYLAKMYNNAEISIELTGGYGVAIMETIRSNHSYHNFTRFKPTTKYKKLVPNKLGWTTSRNSKDIIITEVSDLVRHDEVLIRSSRCLDEMRSLVRDDKGGYGARSGNNDDVHMANGLALMGLRKGSSDNRAKRNTTISHKQFRPGKSNWLQQKGGL